jgi:hypothetical protein
MSTGVVAAVDTQYMNASAASVRPPIGSAKPGRDSGTVGSRVHVRWLMRTTAGVDAALPPAATTQYDTLALGWNTPSVG